MYYRTMLRSRAALMTATAIQRPHPHPHARTITTGGPRVTPDPTRPATDQTGTPKKGGDRNMLYIGGGLLAIGSIWYYYGMAEKERKVPSAAEGGQERIIEDTKRSVKERTEEALKRGDAKYQDVKTEAQSKVQAARDGLDQNIERGKHRFEEGKDEARSVVEQKADAATSTGRGWMNWGKSQTRAASNDLKRRADETQEAWNSRFEDAKRKAAQSGEDIKQRASETEEDFRSRIAEAIQRR